MDDAQLNAIIESVMKEIAAAQAKDSSSPSSSASAATRPQSLNIDLDDPTTSRLRYQPSVKTPKDPEALKALIASTTARLGVGRAGPRYTTRSLLFFQGDHAVTQ
ncbi:MAG: ethanolamine ammonia-lyase, partial [Chloroflexi bacterium]|nr:ethanolamine ammonia-lyase [Chloroflexota bacterium]